MRKRLNKKNIFIILPCFLIISFFSPQEAIYPKELAPHKIYGHLLLNDDIIKEIQDYIVKVRLSRNHTDYIVATYTAGTGPDYADYFVVDIPLDDSLKDGIPIPGDKVDLLVNDFVMAREIKLDVGNITKKDIAFCKYTELHISIEGVKEGADYTEDVLPIIRTRGCVVLVQAPL